MALGQLQVLCFESLLPAADRARSKRVGDMQRNAHYRQQSSYQPLVGKRRQVGENRRLRVARGHV